MAVECGDDGMRGSAGGGAWRGPPGTPREAVQ